MFTCWCPCAQAENHEYLEGRYGELIFNDTTVQLGDVVVGAWVVRQRYDDAGDTGPCSASGRSRRVLLSMQLQSFGRECNSLVGCG